jgi:hypothetical protein
MDLNFSRGKKGQVTLFVILAILIVVLGILLYLFIPDIISSEKSTSDEDPELYLENCIEEEFHKNLRTISENGGVMEPEFYINYSGEKYEYLCYTNEYYKRCVLQKPALRDLFREELEDSLSEKVEECFSSMLEDFETKGYSVSTEDGDFYIQILPERVYLTIERPTSLEKEQKSFNYDEFYIPIESKIYQLLSIANNIIKWEEKEGGVEVTEYMYLYHDLSLRKNLVHDDTTLYTLENKDTNEIFKFASRSLISPSGYM